MDLCYSQGYKRYIKYSIETPITIGLGYGLLIGWSTATGQISIYQVSAGTATPLSTSNVFTITKVDEYHISVTYEDPAEFIAIGKLV